MVKLREAELVFFSPRGKMLQRSGSGIYENRSVKVILRKRKHPRF